MIISIKFLQGMIWYVICLLYWHFYQRGFCFFKTLSPSAYPFHNYENKNNCKVLFSNSFLSRKCIQRDSLAKLQEVEFRQLLNSHLFKSNKENANRLFEIFHHAEKQWLKHRVNTEMDQHLASVVNSNWV